MSITLTPITKGMEKGAESIEANFKAISAEITDTGYIDASKYLTSSFAVYTDDFIQYRIIGHEVSIVGVATPTADLPTGEQIMLTGLPFAIKDGQFHVHAGTNGAYYTLQGKDGQLIVSRYMYDNYADAHKIPVTITKGHWLSLGDTFLLDD
jgi:hypothetical protein